MRQVLFRGKRIDNGEWVYGFYVMYSKSIAYPYSYTNGEHTVVTVPHNFKYEIDFETICQYTGLTDKNGKKIFEGDILKLTDKANCGYCIVYVEFGNPNGKYDWGFQFVKVHGDNLNTDILLWVDMEEAGAYAEVIGNIFDNTELLEVQNG